MVKGQVFILAKYRMGNENNWSRPLKSNSKVMNLDYQYEKQLALENAISRGVSKHVYFKNGDSSDFDDGYEYRLLYTRIYYVDGIKSREKLPTRKARQSIVRHQQNRDINSIDKPISREQQQMELKMDNDGKDRYRAKQPQKRTYKSVQAYRKEKRLEKLKKQSKA